MKPLIFWRKPVEPTLTERIASAARHLVSEIHDRELKLIHDRHLINACKEQLNYLHKAGNALTPVEEITQ